MLAPQGRCRACHLHCRTRSLVRAADSRSADACVHTQGSVGAKHADAQGRAIGAATLAYWRNRASSPRDMSALAASEMRAACDAVLKVRDPCGYTHLFGATWLARLPSFDWGASLYCRRRIDGMAVFRPAAKRNCGGSAVGACSALCCAATTTATGAAGHPVACSARAASRPFIRLFATAAPACRLEFKECLKLHSHQQSSV